jgi:glyoxylase-like metal-dependent hydrolase (beta-lactamase superfamily II)
MSIITISFCSLPFQSCRRTMMMIARLVFILLIQYVYMINIIQVRVSSDASNSWIVQRENEGFIIDCGCYWEHGVLLGQKWREKFPTGKLPSFVFLTHTHPENLLGLVSLLSQLNVTQLPVYVSSSGALTEMNYWLEIWRQINPFETSSLLDKRQSPDQFLFNDHVKVLDRPLTIFNDEQIHIISNFPTAESIHSSMIYIPAVKALFTGDLVAVNSHLLVSPADTYPDSDNHVCNWIGVLQSLSCAFPPSTRVYPVHGDGPSTMPFVETIETNIRWLTYTRALVFNSCNTTFVMRILEDVFRNYSNVDQSRASLANRIPHSAISAGCKCSQSAPNTCGGLQPPACQFVPKNKTQSSRSTALPIACVHQQIPSSSLPLRTSLAFLLAIVSANIF